MKTTNNEVMKERFGYGYEPCACCLKEVVLKSDRFCWECQLALKELSRKIELINDYDL